MLKVGIIGLGFVGSALANALAGKAQVIGHDRFKPSDDLRTVCEAPVVFVCVPTPTKFGTQDILALEDVCADLKNLNYRGVVCIKSTVLPRTCHDLSIKYGLKIVHNPEFLTQNNAEWDTLNPKTILLSGDSDWCQIVARVHELFTSAKVQVFSDYKVTEMAKYFHNTFLATKVAFCNEIASICKTIGVPYEDVLAATISAEGIGAGHTKVPGPDKQTGFGGACFPKDCLAFSAFSRSEMTRFKVLDAAIEANEKHRRFDNHCNEFASRQ